MEIEDLIFLNAFFLNRFLILKMTTIFFNNIFRKVYNQNTFQHDQFNIIINK